MFKLHKVLSSFVFVWFLFFSDLGFAQVFDDDFTDTTGVNLEDHTPTPTGTSWTLEAQDTSERMQILSNHLEYPNGGARHNVYSNLPAPTGTDYTVEMDIVTGFAPGSDDDPFFLIARFQDTSNAIGAGGYRANAAADAKIWKISGGTPSEIATGDTGWAVGDKITLDVSGTSPSIVIVLKKNDVEVISVTIDDSNLDAKGLAGIGGGDFFVAGDDLNGGNEFDNFLVTDTAVVSVPQRTLIGTGT